MQLKFGNYSLRLEKQDQVAPVLVAMNNMQARTPFLYNPYDAPNTNILFIRETVSACMHARSEAIGRGTFHAYQTKRSSNGISSELLLPQEHPLERLLAAPNPIFDMTDLLELSSQWLDATGNALWLKVRNGKDEVIELWPVAAVSFLIERGEDEMPAYYRFLPTDIRVEARNIVHIRRADIRTAPFHGHAILSDILLSAKTESALRLFQERFIENDATPRAVLKWPAGAMMTQDQMDMVRRQWEARYNSASGAGRIAILPDGGDVEILGSNARELDFAKSKRELRDTIREAFKVPQIVLGDVENVNLANAETSYTVFLRDVVDYSLSKHARALTRSLAREFAPDVIIRHDNVIPETEERLLARIQTLKQVMTIDEQRAMLSLPPLGGERGKEFI